jgi:hypothetical protein
MFSPLLPKEIKKVEEGDNDFSFYGKKDENAI